MTRRPLTKDFVKDLRSVPRQVTQNVLGRRPAIDRRTTHHAGYGFILRVRKRIGKAFDGIITVGGRTSRRSASLAMPHGPSSLATPAYVVVTGTDGDAVTSAASNPPDWAGGSSGRPLGSGLSQTD